ncbi:MAG: hypothetical protein E6Q97_19475 [Desulfurellales bacterium]|nr:MAG: hypothetical protein E6Q97_19475 [Desulfurellales bacterium]
MGKRKKRQSHQDEAQAALVQALAAAQGMALPTAEAYAGRAEYLAGAIRNSENAGAVRRIVASRSVCPCAARDEVVVVTANSAGRERALNIAKARGVDPLRPIAVYAVNAHRGVAAPAELDIEDAKRLVNALSEAIAETERLVAEMA